MREGSRGQTRRRDCSDGAFFSWLITARAGLGDVEGDMQGLAGRLSCSMLLERSFPSRPTPFRPIAEKKRRRDNFGLASFCSASDATLLLSNTPENNQPAVKRAHCG